MADITPVRLLVILNEDNNIRMELTNGVPNSLPELIEKVTNACGLEGYIRLQYLDKDFGNIFVNLTSETVIKNVVKDLTVIKVVPLDPDTATVVLSPVDLTVPIPTVSRSSSSGPDSDYSDTTLILSSSGSSHADEQSLLSSSDSLRTLQWPKVFPIPIFSFDTECQLQRGNAEYARSQTVLTPASKMLSDILEKLVEKIYGYKAYPADADYREVALALIKKHPCLTLGAENDRHGWKGRLKVKMGNYRTQLRAHGNTSAELAVNSVKSKAEENAHPAKSVKRPRRAESNHFPSLPTGETEESMEQVRMSLLTELQIRNNRQAVKEKMAKTFAYRRQEIVNKQPGVRLVLEKWPALFLMEEINAEFLRVTTVPLEVKFMAQLDKYSTKLLQIVRSKGGAVKAKLATVLQVLDQQAPDITIRRECLIKCLIIYLGEPVEELVKEYQETQDDEAEVELNKTTMAIFVTRKEHPAHQPKDIKIVIEETMVLNEVPSVDKAFAMLFGLMYALNLQYPKKHKHTFEFVQKVLMELDAKKLSPKVHKLCTELNCQE